MLPRADVLWESISSWLDDPNSAVEYAEQVDDQIAVRMRQDIRDASTVWWRPGHRSLRAELYVIPEPTRNAEAVYRLALTRNRSSYRVNFAVADDGGLMLRARLPNDDVDAASLDSVLGEFFELVELSFGPLVKLAFSRE